MVPIEDIYDAAFDRGRFTALIERLVRTFGATAGFMGWRDMARGEGFQAEFGNDPVWLQRYTETYAKHDVLRPALNALSEGECVTAYRFLQQRAVRECLFYREYLAPQGVVDNLAVNLIKRPSVAAHLALVRMSPKEPFAEADCDRLSTLVPHLRRAVFIQSYLIRTADYASSMGVLDAESSGSMLLMGDQTIAEIAPSLVQLLRLRRGDVLRDDVIGNAIRRSIREKEPVAIEFLADGASPLHLLCESRAIELERFGDLASGPPPTHAAYIKRLDHPRLIAWNAMAALYCLTPTELKVLRDAIEHGDLTSIGDRLGMARATTRTHLHRIYEKTQTRSFAGLSNLAHRFSRVFSE